MDAEWVDGGRGDDPPAPSESVVHGLPGYAMVCGEGG